MVFVSQGKPASNVQESRHSPFHYLSDLAKRQYAANNIEITGNEDLERIRRKWVDMMCSSSENTQPHEVRDGGPQRDPLFNNPSTTKEP